MTANDTIESLSKGMTVVTWRCPKCWRDYGYGYDSEKLKSVGAKYLGAVIRGHKCTTTKEAAK